MDTLIIDRKHATLSVARQRLYLSFPNARRRDVSIPLSHLRSVVMQSDCQLTSSVLQQLGKAGVSLLCLHPRDHRANMYCYGEKHGNNMRRLNQYKLTTNRRFSRCIANLIVRQKIRCHRHHLNSLAQMLPQQTKALHRAAESLKSLLSRVRELPVAHLHGEEGAASMIYFQAYQLGFDRELGFERRNQRPPRDPVNAALSLSYTMVHHQAAMALRSAGLDPQLGFLHQPSYGRDSLACDMTELLRVDINQWVWSMFHDRSLTADHFYQKESAVLMNKTGRQFYYPALHRQLPRWKAQLKRHTRRLTRIIDRAIDY